MIKKLHAIENTHYIFRGEDCMKMFCESLRKHAIKIINYEKRKMIQLANEHQEFHEQTKICYICERNQFVYKYTIGKNYKKVRDDYYFTVT